MAPLKRYPLIFALLFSLLTACKKESPDRIVDDARIPQLGTSWDGCSFRDTLFTTPKAFIEIWGINLDSLSANFDLSFTDGSYNSLLRRVDDYSVKLYFDVNSPSFNMLSSGKYLIQDIDSRYPYNVVEAYLLFIQSGKTFKYPVTTGFIELGMNKDEFLVRYDLSAFVNGIETPISGQYSGSVSVIDQRFKAP